MCPLCKQAGRPTFDHYLSACSHLPAQDKRYLIKSRTVEIEEEGAITDEDPEILCASQPHDPPQITRVSVRASPHLEAFHDHLPLRILLDSGAESSMIRADEADRLGLRISPNTSQIPSQADGGRMSGVVGECKATFYYKDLPLYLMPSLSSPWLLPLLPETHF